LAIAKSIVTAHAGQIQVHSAAGVTRFTITLPLSSAAKG
jgi:signal transduction histidine kinase